MHTRHQYHWHTCYEPPQSVQAPHIGAWIAKELGPVNKVIPPFISIGQRFTVGEGEELKAFHSSITTNKLVLTDLNDSKADIKMLQEVLAAYNQPSLCKRIQTSFLGHLHLVPLSKFDLHLC